MDGYICGLAFCKCFAPDILSLMRNRMKLVVKKATPKRMTKAIEKPLDVLAAALLEFPSKSLLNGKLVV